MSGQETVARTIIVACRGIVTRSWQGVGGLTCSLWRYEGDMMEIYHDLSIIGPIGSGELMFSSANGPIA